MPLRKRKNKRVNRLIKHELGGEIMAKLVD